MTHICIRSWVCMSSLNSVWREWFKAGIFSSATCCFFFFFAEDAPQGLGSNVTLWLFWWEIHLWQSPTAGLCPLNRTEISTSEGFCGLQKEKQNAVSLDDSTLSGMRVLKASEGLKMITFLFFFLLFSSLYSIFCGYLTMWHIQTAAKMVTVWLGIGLVWVKHIFFVFYVCKYIMKLPYLMYVTSLYSGKITHHWHLVSQWTRVFLN